MTEITSSHDINDVFENLLFAEEIAEQTGYEEGFNAGKSQSLKGYHLGYHRGSELAARLGYYYGVAESCLIANTYPPKVVSLAQKLKDDIEKFPQTNDAQFDIIKVAEDIKFRFIKLCSLARIDSAYPEADTLEF